ncbi:phage tail tape measure protein [Paenibacillus ehimensis]|uniref:phage tail tape measure protein n=1 Tax=Paenibacillus ehimensis TaxID=79264 RepID=UPI000472A3A0|nr:phage tail tape measure protein [Paenibacillus ehimensis]
MAETIKGINVVIGAETTGLSKALSDVDKRSRDIQSELKQVEKLLKLDPTNTELVAQKQKLLSDALSNTSEKLDRLKAAQQQVNEQFTKGEISEGQYRAFQREVAKTEQELKKLDAQLNETTKEVTDQSKAVGQLGKDYKESFDQAAQSLGNTFDKAKAVGTGLTVAGGALAAGLGVAVKKAAEFEQGMSNVKAVMSPDEVKEFGGALEQLAVKLGADTKYSATEAARGIEELVKAGVSAEQILDGGLKGALSLATAGELELADAAEIASTALNAFRDDNLSVQQAADLLAGAANASATSVSEMKFSLSAVSSVASGVGLSFKDTTTALAVFAQNGLKGSDAGTSLKTMLMRLTPTTADMHAEFERLGLMTFNAAKAMEYLAANGVKPASTATKDIVDAMMKFSAESAGAKVGSDEANKAFREMAFNAGAMSSAFYDSSGNLKSMAEISGILQNALKDMTAEQRQVALNTIFGSDAIRAGNILYKEGAAGVNKMAEAMSKIGADQVAAEKMNNFNGAVEELSGSFDTLLISIGNALLPALRSIVSVLQTVTDAFNSLSPSMQSAIAITGAVASAFALIGGPLLLLVGFIPQIVAGFTALSSVMTVAGAAFTFLTGPIGLVIAAIAAVAAGVYLVIKNWDELKAFFTNLWSWIDNFFGGWGAEVTAALFPFLGIPLLIAKHWDAIKEGFTTLWGWVKDFFAKWGDLLIPLLGPFLAIPLMVVRHWEDIKVGLEAVWKWIKDTGVEWFNRTKEGFVQIWDGIKTYFSGVWDLIKNIFGGAILLIVDLVTGDFEKLKSDSEAIWNNLKAALGQIWEGIKKVFSGALSVIEGHVTTAWNAMKTVSTTIWDAIVGGIEKAIEWIKNLPSTMVQFGKDMIQGLIDGIKNMTGKVGDAIRGIADQITSGIRKALDIHSPSRVMETLGEYTGEGFAIGIGNTVSDVRQRASDMAAAASGVLAGVSAPSVQAAGASTAGGGGSMVNFEGMFAGANINIRSDDDIRKLAREIWSMAGQAQRGMGGATV